MFEDIKKKFKKAIGVFMVAATLFNVNPKNAAANEQIQPGDEQGPQTSTGYTVDRSGSYTERLEEILAGKPYEESMKEAIREVFREIDKNYDKHAAFEEGSKTKGDYINDTMKTLKDDCSEAVLVEKGDEGSKEYKELQEAQAAGLAYSNKIIAADTEWKEFKKATVLHEITHLAQKGFRVSDKIPFGYKLGYLLREADAVDNGKYVIDPSLKPSGGMALLDKSDNTYVAFANSYFSYPQFHNISKKLEYLVGKKFLEEWKKDENTERDYFEKMGQVIDGKYGKGTFEPIFKNLIKIAPFIKDGQITSPEDKEKVREELLRYRQYNVEKLDKMQNKQEFMTELQNDINDYKESMEQDKKILGDEALLKQKYEERMKSFVNSIDYNEEEISKCNDPEKREKYIEELKGISTDSKDTGYKKYLEEKIDILKNPEKREEYIKNIEETINHLKQDYSRFTIEKYKQELGGSIKFYEEECKNLERYKDTNFFDSEKNKLEESLKLYDVAEKGIDGNLNHSLIALDQEIVNCMGKEVNKASNMQETIRAAKKWHHYKKLFLLEKYSEHENNGSVQTEYHDVFNVKGFEDRLIDKMDQFNVLPRFFEGEQYNRYAKEALLDSNVWDISRASVSTVQKDDKAIMMIYDGRGEIQDVYKIDGQKGVENIYRNVGGDNNFDVSRVAELSESIGNKVGKLPAMNNDSIEKVRTGGDSRDVR